ncbi:MAG: 50S ribosomal protein L10 [Chloroflexi bacterium]|nr:50S ribosomal protein L10 [Chloroflexota bacterium]
MSREQKAQFVEDIQALMSRCNVGILTDYRGLTAADITALRRKLRESGVDYKVVKNTLARIAAKRAGREALGDIFDGPVAIAFGYDDATVPAKVISEYIRSTKSPMTIKGGFMGGRALTASDVDSLATLPPRDVLIAQVLAGMQSPITSFVNVIAAPIRGMMGVLQARIKQLEEG